MCSAGDQGAQRWKLKGGAQQISNGLSESVREWGGHIRYNTCVISVTQCEGGGVQIVCNVSGEMEKENGRGESGGEEQEGEDVEPGRQDCQSQQGIMAVRCKRVILALAPTLTRNVTFFPALPTERRILCEEMLMGSCVKVVVVYTEAFWLRQRDRGGAKDPHVTGEDTCRD